MGRKITQEEFIDRAIKIHGNKYDYSKVVYKNSNKQINIICKKHGEFCQKPQKHLIGQGCPQCGIIKCGINKRNNINTFIDRAIKIHGDKYDYSKSTYTHTRKKINIICKKHGEFWQYPLIHLKGSGCPNCGLDKISDISRSNTTEFIDKAIKIHGNKYDYSKVEYITNRNKVIIICKKHGEFLQTPFNHLCGNDCRECSRYSKGEYLIKQYLLDNKINFIKEKTFNDCLSENNKKLRFDFYLPDFNTIIEYDGLQHFIPIKRFGGEEGFKTSLLRDNIKNKYCKDNNIKLIRISYKNRKKINLILSSYNFNQHKK